MATPKEIEIKLELAPASLPRLKKIPLIRALEAPAKRTTEVSVYFDTDKHKLRKNGVMLRVRHIGTATSRPSRQPAVEDCSSATNGRAKSRAKQPDLGLARGTALEPLISDKFRRQLKPLFETRVTRTVYPLTNGTRTIELTVDQGKIDTGDAIGAAVRNRARAQAREREGAVRRRA